MKTFGNSKTEEEKEQQSYFCQRQTADSKSYDSHGKKLDLCA